MGTKNNPGEFDCYSKADDDEPIFTLRGNDPLASIIVDMWAELYLARKDSDVTKYSEAKTCARAMAHHYWHDKASTSGMVFE